MLRKTLVPTRTQIRLSWALAHTLGYFVKSVRTGNRILPNLDGGILGIRWQTKKEGHKHLPPYCGLLGKARCDSGRRGMRCVSK